MMGQTVAYSVEACCKPGGRGFDSRRGNWIFFNWHNPSSHTMSLGPTQPVTEMSTRNIPGDKGRHAASQPSVGAPTSHNPMGLHGLLQA
jgi:hypothetical protein